MSDALHSIPSHADDVTRALPHAVGPEKSILSSMLQDPVEFIGLAVEMGITGDHFYLPEHRILFDFLRELHDAGVTIELISLIQKLLDRGLLDRAGGPAKITDIYTYAPAPGSFRTHVGHVKDR
jgi:replicative DNA helicase